MHQAFLRLTRLPEWRRIMPHIVPVRTDSRSAGEVSGGEVRRSFAFAQDDRELLEYNYRKG